MPPISEIQKPHDDPYSLIGENWPSESELAYTTAECAADDSATTATIQAESADDAVSKMHDEHGKTADSVSGSYGRTAALLREQAITFTTISAWMVDAAGKTRTAKKQIAVLVRAGTSEIRVALDSELRGTPVSPSSNDLIARYRSDIAAVKSTLGTDLDAIGHSLSGDPGASRTPTYTSIPTSPTAEHPSPTIEVAAFNHSDQPAVEPHQLPPMPRATSPSGVEPPSTPATPAPTANPHAVNPTLSNLISGASPSGTQPSPSAKSSSGPTSGIPAGQGAQAHQPSEQHQQIRPTGLPRIPSITLPNAPAAAADIATAVTSSATASQLPTSTAPSTPSVPVSTGITPGASGAAPVPSAPPAGLAPIGSLPTPSPVVQTPPAPQGAPGTPQAGPQAPSAPQQSPVRGPAADLGWIQRTYGLAPGVELPKSENPLSPALFIAELPESEATLHRVLASLRHQFEAAGWGQPMAVGLIKRGLETRLVYVTADAISIHPHGVLLPQGVTPLDEMTSAPATSELSGSLMVTEKLVAMIPREWTVEGVLSTVSGGESSQTSEQYQELVGSGELLNCSVSRGRDDVGADEAMSVFARAAIGSAGCGQLDVESARIRAARWIGTQPADYLEVLARWHLADAAESMSQGSWGEAVYSSEKYMSVRQSKAQAA
ncbi:Uncharacterised protein [Mycobacteroides abscessus subsp. massiliense]|nr:Uncharacterised protein [Mycobacteroides abscessus subsp. massiliense]SKN98313.1 Uncharacterised protein [Mycobacteroides abscessus subsp. massiliense]